ncbi:MAG: hypothetical protein R3B48_25685 [Kofleriaceae bacterium]
MKYVLLALSVCLLAGPARAEDGERNFAGSIQLDYLAIPTAKDPRQLTLDAATFEASMKVSMDFSSQVSGAVKVCIACHGVETGMAFFDLRVADQLNFRVGRLTPAFGNFPLRHDPANHRTSDKPLPYDMGRMVRIREWNEGVLPSPWVDNGVEINGTQFFDHGQVDYAIYAVSGPKGAVDGADFDFTQSRSAYYVDNNSEPSVGGRIGATLATRRYSLSVGASTMTGHYDPDRKLSFWVAGADGQLQLGALTVRAEYLLRRTEMALGASPETRFKYGPDADGKFASYFLKDGFYAEAELPVGALDVLARWDGLRRRGNVLAQSELRSKSDVYRYTVGGAYRLPSGVRLKVSGEVYDFSDFDDEVALHVGIAGAL